MALRVQKGFALKHVLKFPCIAELCYGGPFLCAFGQFNITGDLACQICQVVSFKFKLQNRDPTPSLGWIRHKQDMLLLILIQV
mmetsp:Transcript_4164/g.7700  ORF Transcript_4164/g.7700 Transcript_4164/m.7700 type:complete len:83 (+) Transcript_4164:1597-1845(+)